MRTATDRRALYTATKDFSKLKSKRKLFMCLGGRSQQMIVTILSLVAAGIIFGINALKVGIY